LFRSFQARLASIFVGLFFLVLLVTFFAVYKATTYNVVGQIKEQLIYSNGTFERHLSDRAKRLSENAAILTADYAFREAIAAHDPATSLSVIRNLGARIRADRIMLVSLEGTIIADTRRPAQSPVDFPYMPLIETAEENDIAESIIVLDERLYDFVIVPVLAPIPIAWIGIGIEVDNAMTHDLRSLSPLALDISFLQHQDRQGWRVIASTLHPSLQDALPDVLSATAIPLADVNVSDRDMPHLKNGVSPNIRRLAGNDYVTLVTSRLTPAYSPPAIALLQYPLEKALSAYQPMFFWLKVLSVLGLLFSALGCILVARSISKPVLTLVDAASRIEHGDYQQAIQLKQKDELGRLALAFNGMMDAIAEREEKILYQAHHDSLSGLPNRLQLEQTLREQINQATHKKEKLAVILIKIERLHEINNTLGHQIGDQLILKIRDRLLLLSRQGDTLAHLTKNTFILLSAGTATDEFLLLAKKVKGLFEEPCAIDDINVDIHLRLGLSFFPQHGDSSKALIQKADVAMYSALQAGKPFAIYDSEKDTFRRDHLSLMSELRQGLLNDELELYYQPKIDLLKNVVTHAEALVRWNHPTKGFMSPDTFIPLAEQSGHINKLTIWALEHAIRQCSTWNKNGHDMSIAVNISVKDLLNKALPDIIVTMLSQFQLGAECLVLEVTESSIMNDPEIALSVLTKLHGLGLRVSIDDFGTGYSSMEYLKKLPADILKIDKSFVMDLAQNKDDEILVRSMIQLAHNLGLKVVAEGIEDEKALAILSTNSCDYVQGFFISRPLPVDAFNEWLNTSTWGGRQAVS